MPKNGAKNEIVFGMKKNTKQKKLFGNFDFETISILSLYSNVRKTEQKVKKNLIDISSNFA